MKLKSKFPEDEGLRGQDGGLTGMKIGGKVGPTIHGSVLSMQASILYYFESGLGC